MARSDPTSWMIEVLEGPAAGAVVELNGRTMPFRAGAGGSVSFGKRQRTKLTWYPGNRTASQQIIGPTVPATTINGVWKERYIGEDGPIDLVELFEELCEQGSQLRVTWQTREYQGAIVAFDSFPGDPTGGLSDIRWQMTFEWNRGDVPATVPRLGDARTSIRDSLISAASLLASLGDAVETFVATVELFVGTLQSPFSPTKRELEDDVEGLAAPIRIQAEAASRSGDEPELPARTVEDASTASRDAQTRCGEIAEVIGGVFPASSTVDDSLETILNDAVARADVVDLSYEAMEEQFEVRERLEEIIRPAQFTTVPAIPGADLREFAVLFYGDPDDWERIAKLNGLETSLIPDDLADLVIPLSLPDATDDRVGNC